MPELTLTDAQLRVVQAAVENYRRCKGAERMLAIQKKNAGSDVQPRYDALVALIASTQDVVGKPVS